MAGEMHPNAVALLSREYKGPQSQNNDRYIFEAKITFQFSFHRASQVWAKKNVERILAEGQFWSSDVKTLLSYMPKLSAGYMLGKDNAFNLKRWEEIASNPS